jgi:hypothetical protein
MQGEVETTETPVRYHTSFGNWFINYFLAPFSWSRWTDITTFSYASQAFLLQGKVNSRTNAKKFKIISFKTRTGIVKIGHMTMEQLALTGLIDDKVKFN